MITLQERFRSLVARHVLRLIIRGRRATGLAPCHDDHSPSFSGDLDRCIWYCHACGRGGGVRDFARLVGEEWCHTRSESHTTRAHRAALAAARDAYGAWQRERLIELSDEYRELAPEAEIAEIAYRATRRCPDLYTPSEVRYWETRLAAVYNRLSELEYSLDLLTYARWEAERLNWWREEDEDGRLAA